MITVATAECFTHGKIGTTLHKMASGYDEVKKHPYYSYVRGNVKIIASMFIPSKYGAEKLLNIKLPRPDYDYKYAKAYSEKNDLIVAYLMANGVKNLLNCNISIGTTAGIGRGGICILTDNNKYTFTTNVNADLITGTNIELRQKRGIDLALNKFVEILKKEYGINRKEYGINSVENNIIH